MEIENKDKKEYEERKASVKGREAARRREERQSKREEESGGSSSLFRNSDRVAASQQHNALYTLSATRFGCKKG